MACVGSTAAVSRRAAAGAFQPASSRAAPRPSVACNMKKGIHPEWYPEAKVVCNGQEVMTVGGTKPSYNVDIYSGNHPFYQGVKTTLIVDEGQLNKFKKRFADLEEMSTIPVLTATAGDDTPVIAVKAGGAKAKGKKK